MTPTTPMLAFVGVFAVIVLIGTIWVELHIDRSEKRISEIEHNLIKDVLRESKTASEFKNNVVQGETAYHHDKVLGDPNKAAFKKEFAKVIKFYWPDATDALIANCYRYSFPAKFGHPKYDWSRASARDAAISYIQEFGEL